MYPSTIKPISTISFQHILYSYIYFHLKTELELELIQTQMAQKPVLQAEVHACALRASQNAKRKTCESEK